MEEVCTQVFFYKQQLSKCIIRQICGRGSIKLFPGLAPGGSSPPEFVPMKKFIYRQHLSIFLKGSNILYVNMLRPRPLCSDTECMYDSNRTFTAKNGKTYTWKSRNFSLRVIYYCILLVLG